MNKSDQNKMKHSLTTQKYVEEALSILRVLYFDLGLSQRTFSEIKSLVHRYYLKFPDSEIKPPTLVGCITYQVSSINNEHISISTISRKVGVSTSWLMKKKGKISTDLNIS
ncbi:MAG: hypothetical protein JSV04_13325 [Candidatus Heimdallarchaeota archaeon]|nr:MAG: hypothetical protein JSV04_13325 [Candidatus Heimdallarchaeota archaeon]